MVNLTKSLAQEFGPKGIHVNAVSPGPVSTDFGSVSTVSHARWGTPPASTPNRPCADRRGLGGFATGRFTTLEEVATLVVLLASEVTANVTGANYIIDGGLIKTT